MAKEDVHCPSESKRLIWNLVLNAIDSMRSGGGRLSISAEWTGDLVELEVRDTGTGISGDHVERIFDPFFSTKGETSTDLGLWVSKNIVESHGGSITVETDTNPNRFSCFASSSVTHIIVLLRIRENILGTKRRWLVRILIVEDEQRLAENIARGLREGAGFAVDCALDGEDGLHMARSNPYDLLIVDLMLPRIDGLAIVNTLRIQGSAVPILVLTARDEKECVVALLNAGADDYVTKPFDLGELVARSKALIRRGKGKSETLLRVQEVEINIADRTVTRCGKAVSLTAMEYRVLEYLAHRSGAVVSKTELLEHLYDFNWEKFSNVVEVYISGLRRKLGDAGGEKVIQTLRGQGYVLRA